MNYTYDKTWHGISNEQPAEGECIAVLYTNGQTDIAYFCDGGFYKLAYDEHLGIMRKVFVNDSVKYWSNYLFLDTYGLKLD